MDKRPRRPRRQAPGTGVVPTGRTVRWHRPAWWLVLAVAALAPTASPQAPDATPAYVEVLPRFNDASTDSFFYFSLGDGRGWVADRLRRDPLAPRLRALSQNLFQEIGRPPRRATVGELLLRPIHSPDGTVRAALLVETSTGYVAYFANVPGNDRLGDIVTTLGRPLTALASTDGNFALLMRRERNGRTEGAYVYHASTGRALYIDGLRELGIDPPTTAVAGLPTLTGRVTATELELPGGETQRFLLIDGGNGDLHLAGVVRGNPRRLAVRKSGRNLFELFPRQASARTVHRFLAVPVRGRGGTTSALIVDVGSGAMAMLGGLDQPVADPTLRAVSVGLTAYLPSRRDPRLLVAIPHTSGPRQTLGVWLLDSSSRAVLYVAGLEDPTTVTVRPARWDRG